MDQNYVQRYHASSSAKEASKSIWLCVWMFVPVSLVFFMIGACLFAYYQVTPGLIEPIKLQAAAEHLGAMASQTSRNHIYHKMRHYFISIIRWL